MYILQVPPYNILTNYKRGIVVFQGRGLEETSTENIANNGTWSLI